MRTSLLWLTEEEAFHYAPPNDEERPSPGDASFAAAVSDWQQRTGASLGYATIFRILEVLTGACAEVQALVRGGSAGRDDAPASAEGVWLADLARKLFGPNGPTVVG